MMGTKNPYDSGAMLLWLAAALVAIAPVFGGSVGYVVVAVVLASFAMGLMRGMRWTGYFAFLVAGIMGGIVIGWLWATNGPALWWAAATTAVCWLSALALFVALWRPKGAAGTT